MPEMVLAVLLGLGLAASTGLNTSLPLLLLAAAAKFQIGGLSLNEKFAWLYSDVAIIVLIVAASVEVIADKFPAVDHALDSVGTFLRPAAGALAAASVLKDVDPAVAAVVGLIIGAPISFGFHTIKAATRVGSSAVTFGCANPVLSLLEDIASIGIAAVAIFAPVVVPVVVVVVAWLLWKIAKRLRRSAASA